MALRFQNKQDQNIPMMMEINTTPLIDVMLVLLVMLIITIPIPLQTVNIEMPSGAPPQQQETPVVVKIMVLNNGSMLWDDQLLQNPTELDAKLAATAQLQPQPEIHIGAQANAPYALIAKALASSQRLGLEKIGVVGLEELANTGSNSLQK